MAFEKKEIDLKGLLLMLSVLQLIAATNIDCNGRPFHCVNSTHFMICVDIGGGLSSTIDDFVLPCPEPTVCDTSNRFECEFPPVNPSTQLGSLHATNSTEIVSEATAESKLSTVSTIWNTSFSETTININNTTVLSLETTIEIFTPGITTVTSIETSTSPDISNITNQEVKKISDSTHDTSIPSTVSTDLWTKPIISTTSLIASSENIHTSNSFTGDHVAVTNFDVTSTLLPEMTTHILTEDIVSTVAITSNNVETTTSTSEDILNTTSNTMSNPNVTTNSAITTDTPLMTTSDAWTKVITTSISPTISDDNLSSTNTYTVNLNTGLNVTSAWKPDLTTESTLTEIRSTVVTTSNNVSNATIANVNDSKLTTDPVKRPVTSTSPTRASNKLSTSNSITIESVVTTDPNVNLTETTTDILIKEMGSNFATTAVDVPIETMDTVNIKITTDSVNNLPSTIANNLTKPLSSTISQTTSDDNVFTSNTNTAESVVSTHSNRNPTLVPEITTDNSIKEIGSTLPPISNEIVNVTIANDTMFTTELMDITDLSSIITNDMTTKLQSSTTTPTMSGHDTSTLNTNPALVKETTIDFSTKGIQSTLAPTSNAVINASISHENDTFTTVSVNIVDLSSTITNDMLIKPLNSTTSPTVSGNDISTSNMNTDVHVISTDLNIISTMATEITIDSSIIGIESTITSIPNDVSKVTIATVNNNKLNTDLVDITALPSMITNDMSAKPLRTTTSPTKSSVNLSSSNTNRVEPVVSTDLNLNPTLTPETTTDHLIKDMGSTHIPPTYNEIVNVTFAPENDIMPNTDLMNITDMTTKLLSSTTSPTISGEGISTLNTNTVVPAVFTDSNVNLTLDTKITTVSLIKEIETTPKFTSNHITDINISTVNNPELNTNTFLSTKLPLTITNYASTILLPSTIDPISSDDKSFTSNTSTVESIVSTHPDLTSKFVSEVTTDILITRIENTTASISNGVPNILLNNGSVPKLTTDSVNISNLPSKATNIMTTKLLPSTISQSRSGDNSFVSNSNTVSLAVSTEPISTLSSDIITDTSINDINNTFALTSNVVPNASIANLNNHKLTTDLVNYTNILLTTTNDVLAKPISTISPTKFIDNLSISKTTDTVIIPESNISSAFKLDRATETSNKITESTFVPEVPNASFSPVNSDSVKTIDLPLITVDDVWTGPSTRNLNPRSFCEELPTSDTITVMPVAYTDIYATSTRASEERTEISNKRIYTTIDFKSNDVSNTTSTDNESKVSINPVDITDLSLKILNDGWITKDLGNRTTVNDTSTNPTTNAPISTKSGTLTYISEMTTEIPTTGIGSTVTLISNDVPNLFSATVNSFKVTNSLDDTDTITESSTSNAAKTNIIFSNLSPSMNDVDLSTSNVNPSKPIIISDSNVTLMLSPEAIKEFAKGIRSTGGPRSTDDLIGSLENNLNKTMDVHVVNTPLITTDNKITKSIFSIKGSTTSGDNLHTLNTKINDTMVTSNSNITSDMPEEIIKELLNEGITSTISPTLSDTLHFSSITDEDKTTTQSYLLSAKTVGVLESSNIVSKDILKDLFNTATITEGNFTTSTNKPSRTVKDHKLSSSRIITSLPTAETVFMSNYISMFQTTEKVLAAGNKTTNIFFTTPTESLFRVQSEAVTPVYENEMNPTEKKSSTVLNHVSDNSENITTESMYIQEFTIKNSSTPSEAINDDSLTISNTFEHSNKLRLISKIRKIDIHPDLTEITRSYVTTHKNIIEKANKSLDKTPVPYLQNTLPQGKFDIATDFRNFIESNTKDTTVLENPTISLLATTDNPQIKMLTSDQVQTLNSMNMTRKNYNTSNHNVNSTLNIYNTPVDLNAIAHINNTNVSTNSNIETTRKQARDVNSTTPQNNRNSTPNILDANSNVNSVNFDCTYHYRGRYADNNDCKKFYICVGRRQPITGICPVNTVFSEIWKQCTKNLSHCVRNNQFRCTSEGRFSDVLQDSVYYICIKSDTHSFYRIKLQCQNGYHLNKTTMKCTLNADEASQSTSVDTDSSSKTSSGSHSSMIITDESEKITKSEFECAEEGTFADPIDCRRYYLCTKNKSQYRRKKKKCDSDEVFHKEKKKCVDADSYEC